MQEKCLSFPFPICKYTYGWILLHHTGLYVAIGVGTVLLCLGRLALLTHPHCSPLCPPYVSLSLSYFSLDPNTARHKLVLCSDATEVKRPLRFPATSQILANYEELMGIIMHSLIAGIFYKDKKYFLCQMSGLKGRITVPELEK